MPATMAAVSPAIATAATPRAMPNPAADLSATPNCLAIWVNSAPMRFVSATVMPILYASLMDRDPFLSPGQERCEFYANLTDDLRSKLESGSAEKTSCRDRDRS